MHCRDFTVEAVEAMEGSHCPLRGCEVRWVPLVPLDMDMGHEAQRQGVAAARARGTLCSAGVVRCTGSMEHGT